MVLFSTEEKGRALEIACRLLTNNDWDSRQWLLKIAYQFGSDDAESRHGSRIAANAGIPSRR